MIITDIGLAPPGGWTFREESTGWTGTAITFSDLARKVAQHRNNMQIPVGDPIADVQNWICAQLNEEDRRAHCGEPPPPTKAQPGDIFSAVIHQITGRYAQTCGKCIERMQHMNKWGWWGCWKNRHEIMGWMLDEARARGHMVTRDHVWSLFKAALREVVH